MTRLSHDELQQAETHTFIGHHIERLNQHQEDLSQLEITFNNYMCRQTKMSQHLRATLIACVVVW